MTTNVFYLVGTRIWKSLNLQFSFCIAEVPPNLPLEKLVQTERNTKRKRIFSFWKGNNA